MAIGNPMPETRTIPFNRSSLLGKELEYIFKTMSVGQIAGDQAFSKKCHALLEQTLGVPKALVTTSCTHALEMAALLLDVQPGNEVIVPSFTFVSTANAFALRGTRIVFADIHPDTLNLDETKLETLITPRTKAIVPVHYAGVGCEMDAILEIAPPAQDSCGGRQRTRVIRQIQGPLARHVRLPCHPEFSRNQKRDLWRGRGAFDKR